MHAHVLGGLAVQPFSLLTRSKVFLPCSAMFPNAHPNVSVGSGHPLAHSLKLHHCEGNDVRLTKLRINYSWWNMALVIKAFPLRAKWSLWSLSPAGSSRLLLLWWDWFSSGHHQNAFCICRIHLKLQQPSGLASHSSSGPTAWPLGHHLPLGQPPNSSSTHPSPLPSLLSSQVSLPWPKYNKHQGRLLGQLWESCLAEPRGSRGLFPDPSHGLLAFPSVLAVTVSPLSSWNSRCLAASLPHGPVCLPLPASLHDGQLANGALANPALDFTPHCSSFGKETCLFFLSFTCLSPFFLPLVFLS